MPTIFDSSTKSAPKPEPVSADSSFKLLTTFAVHPKHIHFETQEKEEHIVLFLRQHIIVNLPWLAIAAVLLSAPTLAFPFLFGFTRFSFAIPAGYLIVGTLFWYLMTFGFILANFIGWFFNIYIITDRRVVDIDFLYLLYKQFSEAELSKIQDISYTTGGILATMFNYGNVSIETAGEMPNFEFDNIPHPEKVVSTIRSLTDRRKR